MDLELHQIDLRYAALRTRDAKRERQLLASLTDVGQLTPVVVVQGEAGRHVLVDGYKRVRVLTRLHRDVAIAVTWELPEADALLLARLMRTSSSESALEQGWLLRELHHRFTLSYGELARRFDKSESWVSRRLALVKELPERIQELVRRGELPAHAAMKHLVPLARAKKDGWQEFAVALAPHRLSSRQVGALTAAWLVATPEGRQLILADPHLVLRAEEQARRPQEKSAAERLASDVAAVAGICRRAKRLVEEESRRAAPGGVFSAAMLRTVDAAEADAGALFAAVRAEVSRVG